MHSSGEEGKDDCLDSCQEGVPPNELRLLSTVYGMLLGQVDCEGVWGTSHVPHGPPFDKGGLKGGR